MLRNGRSCALVSGGVESAALLARALSKGGAVYPVYIRAGHAWERAELYWLRRLWRALRSPRLKPLSILDLPVRDCYRRAAWSLSGERVPSARAPDKAVYLPGRNVLLLAKVSVFCAERGIRRIALGSLGSNPFPDGRAPFFRLMARAASAGLGVPLTIEAPFGKRRKRDVLARRPELPWGLTFSCISPRGLRHCGRCNKCAERKAAFREARIADPARYSN